MTFFSSIKLIESNINKINLFKQIFTCKYLVLKLLNKVTNKTSTVILLYLKEILTEFQTLASTTKSNNFDGRKILNFL